MWIKIINSNLNKQYHQTLNSPKCYYINEGTNVKRSHKGTPRNIDLEFSVYEQALFQNVVCKASFNRIAIDQRVGTVTTKKMKKKSVNPTYLKLHVANDKVTVSPHMTKYGYL